MRVRPVQAIRHLIASMQPAGLRQGIIRRVNVARGSVDVQLIGASQWMHDVKVIGDHALSPVMVGRRCYVRTEPAPPLVMHIAPQTRVGYTTLYDTIAVGAFGEIRSEDYIPGTQGWRLALDGVEFNPLPGAELPASFSGMLRGVAFDVGTISAVGGRLFITPSTMLIADVAVDDTVIKVEDNIFEPQEIIFLHPEASRYEYMKITGSPTQVEGGWQYPVQRNLSGQAPGPNIWDTFTDDDGTRLQDHTMEQGPGWTEVGDGGSVHFEIQDNIAQQNAEGQYNRYAVTNIGTDKNFTIEVDWKHQGYCEIGLTFRYVDASNNWVVGMNYSNLYIGKFVDGGWYPYASVDVSPGADFHHIKVTVDRWSLVKVYYDDTLMITHWIGDVHGGATQVGLYCYDQTSNIRWDNFKVVSGVEGQLADPDILLDHFTGTDGTMLESHTPDIKPSGAAWAVNNDNIGIYSNQIRQIADNVRDVAHIEGNRGYLMRIWVALQTIAMGDELGHNVLGVVFRYHDADNYFYLRFNLQSGDQSMVLYKRVGGEETSLGSWTPQPNWGAGGGYDKGWLFRIQVDADDRIRVYAYGQSEYQDPTGETPVIDVTDSALRNYTEVGILAQYETTNRLDTLRVYTPEGEAAGDDGGGDGGGGGETWPQTFNKYEIVASMAKAGGGYLTLDADSEYTPFLEVVQRNSTTWNDITVQARLGYIGGIFDNTLNPTGYGLYGRNVFLQGTFYGDASDKHPFLFNAAKTIYMGVSASGNDLIFRDITVGEEKTLNDLVGGGGGGGATERWWANAVVHPTEDKGTHTTIQAAINALGTSGGVIYVAPGTYNECISIPANTTKLRIVGAGIKQTIIQCSTSGTAALTIGSGCKHIIVENLTIKHTLTDSGSHCVRATAGSTEDIYFHHVRCEGGDHGMYFAYTKRLWIHDCYIYDPNSYGIRVSDYEDIFIARNKIYSSGNTAIYVKSLIRYVIASNVIHSPNSYGIYAESCDTGHIGGNVIIGGTTAIWTSGDYVTIVANICYDPSTNGIRIYGSYAASIGNNAIYSPGGDGLYIENGKECTIADNIIRNGAANGIYSKGSNRCTYVGNSVYNCSGGDGFTCYNSSTYPTIRCVICNNVFCGNSQYGIDLAGTYAQYNSVVGNILRDNTSGATNNMGGTGNEVAHNVA